MLKGIYHHQAVPKPLKEPWDLTLILDYLAGPLFEPPDKASFRNLARKTVFLLQLASGRRVSWTHALNTDRGFTRFDQGGVTFVPYLAYEKTQTSFRSSEPIYMASLKNFSPDDKVHCPVRALKFYLKRAEPVRGPEKATFLTSIEPHQRASKNTVSSWIKSVIQDAYKAGQEDLPENVDMRAHSTRKTAASWAHCAGISIEEIMLAADWKRQYTFASFYLSRLALDKSRFSTGVVTTAAASLRERKSTAAR